MWNLNILMLKMLKGELWLLNAKKRVEVVRTGEVFINRFPAVDRISKFSWAIALMSFIFQK